MNKSIRPGDNCGSMGWAPPAICEIIPEGIAGKPETSIAYSFGFTRADILENPDIRSLAESKKAEAIKLILRDAEKYIKIEHGVQNDGDEYYFLSLLVADRRDHENNYT